MDVTAVLRALERAGARRGGPLALALSTDPATRRTTGVLAGPHGTCVPLEDAVVAVAAVEAALRPRWVWWSASEVAALVRAGVRPDTCWDVVAVHGLRAGGASSGPAQAWAASRGLDPAGVPLAGQLDLLSLGPAAETHAEGADGDGGDPEDPVRPDGHLRPEWLGPAPRPPARLAAWAALALDAATAQQRDLTTPEHRAAAYAESAAALLCVELETDGLPVDVPAAHDLLRGLVGDRPADDGAAARSRAARDATVLRHAPDGTSADLRNPADVRLLLGRVGLDLPDTRSWRLEPFRSAHPLVDALVRWRKVERVATTYGWTWLERHVGPDGRLRGAWGVTDGAAGRMTAQAGLHNLPTELRPVVAPAEGRVLVRADLGQVEPRVLAAVSGDPALVAATADDDLYAPVAARLRVDRPVAKVAVLAAMYGQTSGTAGQALRGLESAYPVAMAYLQQAHDHGRAGRAVRTHGGRRVPMWPLAPSLPEDVERAQRAARGRFARNAVVQGSAAELFKAWAATVRVLVRPLDARIVLCLHDELLVEAPAARADEVAALVTAGLDRAVRGWAPTAGTRFVVDVRVVRRWSDAKD